MATFAKPENALKRAEELMNVGQKAAALQQLHDLITSKRYRAWQKPLEKIMMKYVELCVDMRKGRFAKDGLIQYRIVCQQVNVSSLEDVIKHFIHLSTERAELAQSQAQAAVVTLDVDDLEAENSPEDLMLSYVSGERSRDRSDRELVTPWFKFLWETYRTVLEILRNNSKLEGLYAMTALRAFHFCHQYKRTTEFRRLCEILRNHLANLNKYRDQRDRPDLTLPETLQHYLDIRLEQLKVATELELWQEAFRSVEDIHGLMSMVKKSPKPQMMAVYYAKLIKIFWMSDSHLYHAYAWFKLYNLQKSYNKILTAKDLTPMANSVLLATISISPYDRKHGAHHVELEMEKDRNVRMANLLGFSLDPKRDSREVLSRSALLSEIAAKGLLAYVSPEVKDLYNLLENEFHPLDLASKVEPLLSKLPLLSEKLPSASPVPEVHPEQYIPALEDLTTLRVLQQVSQVYQTMKIANLSRMIPFYDFPVVEKLAVDAVKYNFFQMKIDYLSGSVQFGSQDLESDKVKHHLTILAKRLNKAVGLIHPPKDETSRQRQLFSDLLAVVEKDHKKLLARKVIIEKRKEDHERRLLRQEQEEANKKHMLQTQHQQAEATRLVKESEQRNQERLRREMEQKQLEETIRFIAENTKDSKRGGGRKKPLEISTREEALTEYRNQQINKALEAERKLLKLAKSMDYLERAKREVERPLLEAAYYKRQEDDRVFFEQQEQREVEQSRVQHAEDLGEKHRLVKMLAEKEKFQAEVRERRQEEFERLRQLREEQRAESKALEREDLIRRRKMEYYRRQEEARLLKVMEEEEARKKEEEEKKRIQDAERKARLEEIAAKQRQREAEAEEKAKKDRENITSRFTRSSLAPVSDHHNAAPASAAAGEARKYVPPSQREGLPKREEGPPRSFGREEGPPRSFGREEGPPRNFGREEGPPRNFGREEGPPRSFGREEGPPRSFGREEGPPRNFGREEGPPRSFGREEGPPRSFGDRSFGRDEGPRGYDRDRDNYSSRPEQRSPAPAATSGAAATGAAAPSRPGGTYRPPSRRDPASEAPPPSARPVHSRW